jgi:hypothetical protein
MLAPSPGTLRDLSDLSDVRALLDAHASLRRLSPGSGSAAAAAVAAALASAASAPSPALAAAAAALPARAASPQRRAGSPPTARELCFANALTATQARARTHTSLPRHFTAFVHPFALPFFSLLSARGFDRGACARADVRALRPHARATPQAGVGRLGASFDAAEADVDAALAASAAAAAGAAHRRAAELASLREALAAKDRALASLRETLESAWLAPRSEGVLHAHPHPPRPKTEKCAVAPPHSTVC